ncbi:hypothetical protein LEP1GSC008_1166 [Leptospira kirschneri serovar Bulgarica str. Nikolaevo]|uniref:Uncharacterized protein n=1 Tax=Leptospira kirschneri serovar Bulgarica str. Nikolaevo TaxID=1240687 RepID=M6FAG9_9LEPT|nr:hypothetical protein LEP1GSC008_1166 [Leptospira kirschneri serovar Bulgarica str. Nikolaevo]
MFLETILKATFFSIKAVSKASILFSNRFGNMPQSIFEMNSGNLEIINASSSL